MGGERDGDGGGDYARRGEFSGFADVDEDWFLGWRGGRVGGEGRVYLYFVLAIGFPWKDMGGGTYIVKPPLSP